MLEDGEIVTICSENTTASYVSSQLISNANEKGGHDNSTVTIFHTLSASHSIDNPLASAIKRDLNERKAPKSNLLKLIVLVLLIGGTLGALYTSFKDDLNLKALSGDSSEEFVVLVSDLSLKEIKLSVGDTVFYEKKPGTLQVVIDIAQLRSATTLDTNAFENQISRQFYVLDGSEEKGDEDESQEKVDEEVANSNIKEESPDIESKESKPSESEESETVSTTSNGQWRVQLQARHDFEDKRKSFRHLKIDHSEILVRWNAEQGLWKYYSRCFESKENAVEWKKKHLSNSKDKPFFVNNISCDLEDQNPDSINKTISKTTSNSAKQKPELNKIGSTESEEKENEVESVSDQETKPTEEVISTPEEEKQEDLKPDSNVVKSDTSNTEGDKNI
jgi:hypothetical protein